MKVCIPIPVVSGKTEKLSETGSTKQLNQSSEKADEPGSNNQTQKGGIVSSTVLKVNRLLLFLLVIVILSF